MRLAIDYTDGTTDATNVLHFLCHETAGVADLDVRAVGQDLYNLWKVVWAGDASNVWHTVQYHILYAQIEGAPLVSRATLADAYAGLSGGAPDYANTAYLINWSTGDPRRGGKPRTYLPGVHEASNANSADLNSTTISGINGRIPTFLAGIPASSHGGLTADELVEYSTVLNGAYRPAGVSYGINAGTVNPVIGSQRRRVDRLRA
jgi:hypothetical protein